MRSAFIELELKREADLLIKERRDAEVKNEQERPQGKDR